MKVDFCHFLNVIFIALAKNGMIGVRAQNSSLVCTVRFILININIKRSILQASCQDKVLEFITYHLNLVISSLKFFHFYKAIH